MDAKNFHQRSSRHEHPGTAPDLALNSPSFELGSNGEKYELTLTPEGDRAKLFPLVYFPRRAPAAVLEHWNI